jgi:hypothetical protein
MVWLDIFIYSQRGQSGRNNKEKGGLDPGRVEHDADPGSHGLGRQVAAELGAHRASVPVRAGHLHQQIIICYNL